MVDSVLFAELVNLIQQFFVVLDLSAVHIDALDVFLELNRTMDLDLLVGSSATR